jgi:hypothetical protein
VTTQPASPGGPSSPRASWSARWGRATWLILRGATWRVALPVALVVGTLLAAVNQGSELIAGDADAATLVRMAANYAIPYVVSSVGYLSAQTGPTESRQARLD